MAYDYQNDFPPILFSTFKPVPPNKDVPAGSPTTCHKEDILSVETAIEAKNKNTETSRNPGASLKDQTYQWFERTQRKKLLKNGRFADWFHGFITRRGTERCRHFVLNHLEDNQYVIEGEESVHPSLEDLLNHYSRFPVEPYKETLTKACPMNPLRQNVSSPTQHNPPDVAAGKEMYARVSKQHQVPSDSALLLATSPKDRSNLLCDSKTPAEYASPSFQRKVLRYPRREPRPSPQDLDLARRSIEEESDEEPEFHPSSYNPLEEIHTYSEPSLWDRPREGTISHDSEPIAFYAVGRGSCKDTMENVYSEVDVNSIASCRSRAAMNRNVGLSTLPHPAPKPVKHKTTAFHSSFRSHNSKVASPLEDPRRGQFSVPKTRLKATIQLDDPMYGKGQLQHSAPPNLDEENIYEKIPENCVATIRNNPTGRKAR
ncbi:SH2 domain-containing protein 2A [Leptodactylus fuscus]|uniref:SH2 domain-containing protein 2A n=1 Tax=Leptodactylus fuscus TaxID=238119 RepID=UPI003F4F09E7